MAVGTCCSSGAELYRCDCIFDYSQPEYRIYEAGSAGQYRYEQGSQEYPQAQKGMPTWAKALIIIGLVIFAICIIGMVVSVINYITGYSTGYHYHNDFGYGF